MKTVIATSVLFAVLAAPAAAQCPDRHGRQGLCAGGGGGEAREINPGDVVWIPANVNHWHGATDKTGMSHIALTYVRDGSGITWGEKVTDEQFGC